MRRVYFIKPIGMDGPIKIGCSYSPDGRRRTLQCWSPFPLEIVAEIDGDLSLERRFHALFADSHKSGEWFEWSQKLQEVVDAVASGAFDVSTLPEPRQLPRRKARGNGWSERQKRIQSYAARIRHIGRKQHYFLPRHLSDWRCYVEDAERMAPITAFLADPKKHGLSQAEDLAQRKAHLRSLNSPFAERLLQQLEVAA